ncbi:MAG TPA: trypsin-like peptidase domain-containing protein [Burkholderiaceae bacterium]|nr:trypsin-like peptidase domain-containing protein [Burkholderiaceae bacterium]
MRRPALYSSTSRAVDTAEVSALHTDPAAAAANANQAKHSRWHHLSLSPSSPRVLWSAIALLACLLVLSLSLSLRQGARKLTQDDINAAVLKTLETTTLPAQTAKAYETIRPSVVRVVGYVKKSSLRDKDGKPPKPDAKPAKAGSAAPAAKVEDEEVEHGVGTGVVIVDKGIILTNLHVVQGAERITVTFSDGLESTASVISVQPENDLAVLQAHKIPDDMIAATMRSTADLAPGDQVLAVGFPFGIGPSASAGIVSGLKRAFRSPEGKQEITNLIQFDAAANPGNSGGPLVTMEGEVVGIVTAILNPTPARTFIGIGFAVPIENAASAAGLPPF